MANSFEVEENGFWLRLWSLVAGVLVVIASLITVSCQADHRRLERIINNGILPGAAECAINGSSSTGDRQLFCIEQNKLEAERRK